MLGKINKKGKLINGYKPHPAQKMIHEDDTRFRICVCGRRFGKTLLALNELYKRAWLNTDKLARCWYVAPNYRQAKSVAWEMLKEVVPEQAIEKINEAELSMTLINKTTIELKGADSQDSLRGAKLKFVVMDEYATMRATVWEEVIRPALTDVPGSRGIFIGTPAGYNHFKKLFDRGLSGDPEYKSYRFRTLDNPHILKKEIEELKLTTNPVLFRQEYEASFEQMTGSIYPMFKRESHVVKDMQFNPDLERVVAMDWGSRNPTAIIFAVIDADSQIWVYDLLYDSGKTVKEWSEILKARGDFEQISNWTIDPSALAQAKEFSQYGIDFTSYNPETNKRLNDVTIGINLVSQFFLEGRIRIASHCEVLITQLEHYHWDPSVSKMGADAKPKPLKKDDHAPDALRYLVMTRPEGITKPKKKYKGLDPKSEMFWRSHFNDMPKPVKDLQGVQDDLLGGLDTRPPNDQDDWTKYL